MNPVTADLPTTGMERIEYTASSTETATPTFSNTSYYQYASIREHDLLLSDAERQLKRRFDRLMGRFQDEWQNGKHYFEGTKEQDIQGTVIQLTELLLRTSPQKVALELTPEATVFFTCIYKNKNAYVEAHYEAGQPTEFVVNVYEAKQPVFAYGGSLADTVKALFRFLDIH